MMKMTSLTESEKKSSGNPSTGLTSSRKIQCTALFIFLLLLMCEVAVRVRARIKHGAVQTDTTNEMLAFEEKLELRIPRPGYETKGHTNSIKINSLGFRGEEITVSKPPNTIRVACLGASTTFCTGVSNNHATWPQQLQEELQREHPGISVQVINAGVPGCTISYSLTNLQRRVLPLEPDLVVFYEANNDMAEDTRALAQKRGVIGPNASYLSPTARFLSEWSLLFDLVYKNTKIASARSDKKTGKLNGIPKELPARFVGEIEKIHRELKQRDIPLVLSVFLTKYRRDQERALQIANADVAFYYMPWMSISDLLDGMDYYNNAIIEYAHTHQLPVLEDRDSIPADSSHFVDFAHLADEGCLAMAKRFAHYLEETGLMQQVIEKAEGK